MPGCPSELPKALAVGDAPSEADAIIRNLRMLRNQIVTAWRERAVILTPEEQIALHEEVNRTCDFLSDLTRHN